MPMIGYGRDAKPPRKIMLSLRLCVFAIPMIKYSGGTIKRAKGRAFIDNPINLSGGFSQKA